jgi:hypothetical protein
MPRRTCHDATCHTLPPHAADAPRHYATFRHITPHAITPHGWPRHMPHAATPLICHTLQPRRLPPFCHDALYMPLHATCWMRHMPLYGDAVSQIHIRHYVTRAIYAIRHTPHRHTLHAMMYATFATLRYMPHAPHVTRHDVTCHIYAATPHAADATCRYAITATCATLPFRHMRHMPHCRHVTRAGYATPCHITRR